MGSRNIYPLYPMIIEAEQTAGNILEEYIGILNGISIVLKSGILKGDIIKDYIGLPPEKFEELNRKFEEIRKKFVESSFILKLSEFIESTRPREVDIILLSKIYDIIKRVKNDIIPCYINNGLDCEKNFNLEKYEKGLDVLLSIHYDLLDLWQRVYHNKLDLPNFEQSLADVYSLMYNIGQIVDTETLMRLARKEAALRCIGNTVDDLFENPDKHQQFIKEGRYLDIILKKYCK